MNARFSLHRLRFVPPIVPHTLKGYLPKPQEVQAGNYTKQSGENFVAMELHTMQ